MNYNETNTTNNTLEHDHLLELLKYHEEEGVFTYNYSPCNSIHKGQIAGCINGNGYMHIRIQGTIYQQHRLVYFYMTGMWPQKQIDHKNHITHDNRWSNLREVSISDNMRNKSLYSNNTSGCPGVTFEERRGHWRAVIRNNNKSIHLGYFNTKTEAICARKEAEHKYNYYSNHGIDSNHYTVRGNI